MAIADIHAFETVFLCVVVAVSADMIRLAFCCVSALLTESAIGSRRVVRSDTLNLSTVMVCRTIYPQKCDSVSMRQILNTLVKNFSDRLQILVEFLRILNCKIDAHVLDNFAFIHCLFSSHVGAVCLVCDARNCLNRQSDNLH